MHNRHSIVVPLLALAPWLAFSPAAGAEAPILTVADINGDGLSDLIALDGNGGGGFLLNAGKGVFEPDGTFYAQSPRTGGVLYRDAGGSGDPDLLLLYPDEGGFEAAEGPEFDQSASTFVQGLGVRATSFDVRDTGGPLAAVGFGGGEIRVVEIPFGGKPHQAHSEIQTKGPVGGLLWMDVNQDGAQELVALARADGPKVFSYALAPGSNPPKWEASLLAELPDGPFGNIARAELNGDSNPDLLVWGSGKEAVALISNGGGIFNEGSLTIRPASALIAADLTGDGRDDIAAVSLDGTSAWAYINGGGLSFDEIELPLAGEAGAIAAGYFFAPFGDGSVRSLLIWSGGESLGAKSAFPAQNGGPFSMGQLSLLGWDGDSFEIQQETEAPELGDPQANYQNALVYKTTDLDAGRYYPYRSYWVEDWTMGASPIAGGQVTVERETLGNNGLEPAPPVTLGGLDFLANPADYEVHVNYHQDFESVFFFGRPQMPRQLRIEATPPSGLYKKTIVVTPDSEPGADIHYRVGGGAWSAYTAATEIILYESAEVEFYAETGGVFSPTLTMTYEIDQHPYADSDFDGIPDRYEDDLDLPIFSSSTDFDGDGVNDLDELAQGSDAGDPASLPQNSDDDGWGDWVESAAGTDANSAQSRPVSSGLLDGEYDLTASAVLRTTADGEADSTGPGSRLTAWSLLNNEIGSATKEAGPWNLRLPGGSPLMLRMRDGTSNTVVMLSFSPEYIPCIDPASLADGSVTPAQWVGLVQDQIIAEKLTTRSVEFSAPSMAAALALEWWLLSMTGEPDIMVWGDPHVSFDRDEIQALAAEYDFGAVFAHLQAQLPADNAFTALVAGMVDWARNNPPSQDTDLTLLQLLMDLPVDPSLHPPAWTAETVTAARAAVESALAGIPSKRATLNGTVELVDGEAVLESGGNAYQVDWGGANLIAGSQLTVEGVFVYECSNSDQRVLVAESITNYQPLLALNDLDSDGDDLPDEWEEYYFASLEYDGEDDPDNDTVVNSDELDGLSHPGKANSVPSQATPTPVATPTQPVATPTPVGPATPTPTPTATPTPGGAAAYDEILLAHGPGGQNLVNVRNFDPNGGAPRNAVIDSYYALTSAFKSAAGGGDGRATYLSAGDLNGDGVTDIVESFGPITADATHPNIVIPRDSQTKIPVGHSFSPFPKGSGNVVRYSTGELRTAVGDFKTAGQNLIAVAQGAGSQLSLARLFLRTGNPAPNGWQIVGQFQPLDNTPTQNNQNGGVSLAAGDVDGDGMDELLAGQTNSPTSLTQFTVLDIDATGNLPVRTNYVGFPPGFRGRGGVELTVADLNGDGINEIVAAGKGVQGTADIGSVLSVIRPVVAGQQVTGFARPQSSLLKVIGNDAINPGGGLNLAAGEFDGDGGNGEEILYGSGEDAPQSFYRVIKLLYDPAAGPTGTVTGFNFLIGPPKNVNFVQNAFVAPFNPTSGAVYAAAGDVN